MLPALPCHADVIVFCLHGPALGKAQASARKSSESRASSTSKRFRDSPDYSLGVLEAGDRLLEIELPCELEAACGVGRCNRSEGGVTKVGVRFEEVRVIESIEQFEAELNAHAFRDLPPFLDAGVEVHESRRTKIGQKSGCVTEGKRRRLRERRGVGPVVDRLILRTRIPSRHDVWTLVKTEARRVVRSRIDGKRQSGVSRHDARPLPTTEDRVHRLAPIAAELLSL